MEFKNVAIKSIAHIDAPEQISSDEIGERLAPLLAKFKFGPKIIQTLTGINNRKLWPAGTQPSEVATRAAVKALEMANLGRDKVNVLVNSSVCKDYIEPSVASLVHGNLGLGPDCMNFDVGNACLAFLDAMNIVGNMIERGQLDYGLIVNGEGSRFILDRTIERLLSNNADEKELRSNFATMTLGSGAVAMVLCRAELHPESSKLVGSVTMAATQHNDLCRGQVDEMRTDAGKLLNAGIELAKNTYQKAYRELDWDKKDFHHYAIHQVSRVHTFKLADTLKIPREKIYTIVEEYGNVGPASIPIVVSKLNEEGKLNKGDRLGLLGIGSGLNCSMMEIIW